MHAVLCMLGFYVTVPGDYGGVQANATAYFGNVHVNAENGTVIFRFRVLIDLRHFNNNIDFINVELVQNNFAERIFSFSNYRQQRNFSISDHGGVDAVNASNVFPELRLLQNRFLVYEDDVIYSYQDGFSSSSTQLPTTVDFDLNLFVSGQNSDNIEERIPFAVATVALITDLSEGIPTFTNNINY